jgi:hypothetical protein
MASAPTTATGTWSTHRLLDTIIGCSINIANYLVWPRDTETDSSFASQRAHRPPD